MGLRLLNNRSKVVFHIEDGATNHQDIIILIENLVFYL